MGDPRKDQSGNRPFRVFSAPRVSGSTPQDGGACVVEVASMEICDPRGNEGLHVLIDGGGWA